MNWNDGANPFSPQGREEHPNQPDQQGQQDQQGQPDEQGHQNDPHASWPTPFGQQASTAHQASTAAGGDTPAQNDAPQWQQGGHEQFAPQFGQHQDASEWQQPEPTEQFPPMQQFPSAPQFGQQFEQAQQFNAPARGYEQAPLGDATPSDSTADTANDNGDNHSSVFDEFIEPAPTSGVDETASAAQDVPDASVNADAQPSDDADTNDAFAAAASTNAPAAEASWSPAGVWTNDQAPGDGSNLPGQQDTQVFPTGVGAEQGFSPAAGDTVAYPTDGFPNSSAPNPDAQPTEAYAGFPQWGETTGAEGFNRSAHGPDTYPTEAYPHEPGAGPFPSAGQHPHEQVPFGPQDPSATAAAPAETPWFKRKAIIIPLVAVLVLGIAAAIGVPWFLHQQKVNRGNELAAAFQADLAEYEKVWTKENIESVNVADLGTIVRETGIAFYDLPPTGRSTMQSSCDLLADARARYDELAAATLPELPQEEGVDASEDYKAAQADAQKLAQQKQDADAFLESSNKSLTAQEEYCKTYKDYSAIAEDFRNDNANTLPGAYVVENGGRVDIGGGKYFPCENEKGCADLYNKDNRDKYINAIDATFVDYFDSLAKVYKDKCFLTDFQTVCDQAAKDYKAAADAHRAELDYLRKTEPTVEIGKPLYPELDGYEKASNDSIATADKNTLDAWKKIEPSVTGDFSSTGNSLANYFDGLRDSAVEAGSVLIK